MGVFDIIDSGTYDFILLLIALVLAGIYYMEWAHRLIDWIMRWRRGKVSD